MNNSVSKNILDLSKPLISEFFDEDTKKQAVVFITPVMGYEVVFYVDGVEVKRENMINKLQKAEDMAENWVMGEVN